MTAQSSEPRLGPVLSALADPLRRRVIRDLAADPDDADRGCVSFGLPVSKATRSHHFRVLREAGLVDQVDRGNRSTVRLRRAELDERFPGLLALISAETDAPVDGLSGRDGRTLPAGLSAGGLRRGAVVSDLHV